MKSPAVKVILLNGFVDFLERFVVRKRELF